MKIFNLILPAILCLSLNAFASNGGPTSENPKTKKPASPNSLSNVFIEDVEGEVLFIDFHPIQDNVSVIRVYKGDELRMEDDVSMLSSDVIYELDLNFISDGNYVIEIETSQQIKIRKEIIVDGMAKN